MFGCVKDFQPIVDELVEVRQKDEEDRSHVGHR